MYKKEYRRNLGNVTEMFKARYYCITRTDLQAACEEIEQMLKDGWRICEKHYWEDRFMYVYRKTVWKKFN